MKATFAGLVLAACFALTVLAGSKPPCPKGLKCQSKYTLQAAQMHGYRGNPYGCVLASGAGAPPPDLDNEHAVVTTDLFYLAFELNNFETPLMKRTIGYLDFAHWNALTAFHPTALPYYYAPGHGLPFARRISGAANTTRARNTAMAYAFFRLASNMVPNTKPFVDGLTSFGLDPNYTSTSNLNDPRDIGNLVGKAMIAFVESDGWNQKGDIDGSGMPYADYTNFLPVNGFAKMTDITKWQPILETNGVGYFRPQTHIAAHLAAGRVTPFSHPREAFYAKYAPKDSKFNAPYPLQDVLDMEGYKAQADVVIEELSKINDTQKMLAELFDVKPVGFGLVPIGQYIARNNWNMFQAVGFYAAAHGALFDAIVTSWKLKIQANAVRPISAIRYMYADTNVSSYGGPDHGIVSKPGRFFNSYLRTMPHADYPSATACFCVAFAEVAEDYLGMQGRLPYEVSFKKGCSMVEPGKTPAQDITVRWDNTEKFIRDCAQTRVSVGVHFQQSVDAGIAACTGLGHDAYKKFQDLLAGRA